MKKGMQWPIGVAAVLGLTIAANIYVMVRANGEPLCHRHGPAGEGARSCRH